MKRYAVEVRTLLWPAPEFTIEGRGPYRFRWMARLVALALRRHRVGKWRGTRVFEVDVPRSPLPEQLRAALREEAANMHRAEVVLFALAVLLHFAWSAVALMHRIGPEVIALMGAEVAALFALSWVWWRAMPPEESQPPIAEAPPPIVEAPPLPRVESRRPPAAAPSVPRNTEPALL